MRGDVFGMAWGNVSERRGARQARERSEIGCQRSEVRAAWKTWKCALASYQFLIVC